jgi:hypothetical protein|tara:strand:- start:1135 stop:1506 length:372 start_codon:yes stop_codon:yes gene_type:complete
MWQRRKLSTNEALSEPGPLPTNWGPIFGLHGFLDKIGDLSWIGPTYADQGWVELTSAEQETVRKTEVMARVEAEKTIANTALSDPAITVEKKVTWSEHLIALDQVCLDPDFHSDPSFPPRPNA